MDTRSRRSFFFFSSSPCEDLSITKSNSTASQQLLPPSQHCLEALNSAATTDLSMKPESQSSLLDLYEIEIINRELERFIISSGADFNDESGGSRGKVVGPGALDLSRFHKFFARQAVALCGSNGTVVLERRPAAGGSGRKPA